jgi:hypothetical protein
MGKLETGTIDLGMLNSKEAIEIYDKLFILLTRTFIHTIMHQAMDGSKKPTIIEAYVDPIEPPMSSKVEMSFVNNLAESLARGQSYASIIGLTLCRNQIHNILKNIHSHSVKKMETD